jgi:hypothetical protein
MVGVVVAVVVVAADVVDFGEGIDYCSNDDVEEGAVDLK